MTDTKKISVILVDDHPIFRDGLKSLLTTEPDIEVTGEAGDASALMTLLTDGLPDVIIMDITLPGSSGIEATRQITAQYPCAAILILSMHTAHEYVVNSIEAGARGYLPKDVSKQELIEAIRAITSGHDYFSRLVSETVLRGMVQRKQHDTETALLTQREKEILSLAASGMANKEIASKLFISPRTVDCHKNHIMQKLSLKSGAELILYAVRSGLVKL